MAALETILNVTIPWIAVFFFGAVLYKKVQEPVERLFGWIGDMIRERKEKEDDGPDPFSEQEYMYVPWDKQK